MNSRKKPATFLAVASFFLMFFLLGCSGDYNKTQLAGKYFLNVGHRVDMLELKNDGTYTHSFPSKEGVTASHSGTWELEKLDAGQTVTLHDFQPLPGGGYYLLPITSFLGKICLMTNEDTNECYEKQ